MAVKEILNSNNELINQATSLLSDLSDRDGAYIWEKYSYALPASDVYALSGTDGRIIYYSDAYTLSGSTYALVNPKSISLWASDTTVVSKLAGKYFLVAATSGTMMYRGMDTITTVLSGTDLYLRNVHVISNITEDVLEHVGYAVGDEVDSFPDGGELDGYWYQVMKAGGGINTNVWNVYDGYTPAKTISITFQYVSQTDTTFTLQVVVTNGTYSDVTPSMLSGMTIFTNPSYNGTKYEVKFENTTTAYNYYDGTKMTTSPYTWTYNASNGRITFSAGTWQGEQNYVAAQLKGWMTASNATIHSKNATVAAKIGAQLGFITDNDSSAYPNGAVGNDGKYYTLLKSV